MKKFLWSLWPAFMTALIVMALASPLIFVLWIVLLILGLENYMNHAVILYCVAIYAYQLYRFCKDEGPPS